MPGYSAWVFWGVKSWTRDFGVLIFASIRSSLSLKIQRPPPRGGIDPPCLYLRHLRRPRGSQSGRYNVRGESLLYCIVPTICPWVSEDVSERIQRLIPEN